MRSTRDKLEAGAHVALLGSGLNAILCVVKIGGGLLGNSYALIADGFESLMDVLSSLLTWAGMKYAAKPPDDTHPYGHGKAEPMAAILGSVIIMVAAAGLAIESVQQISSARSAPSIYTLPVLIVVIVAKALHSRRVHKLADDTHSMAMEADALHHWTDAITSASAVIGIAIALLGGPAYRKADNWAALFACAIIGYNGIRIFWPALRDLMDTAPSIQLVEDVRNASLRVVGVRETEQCRIRKMGLEYYVDMHVRVDGSMTVTEGHQIAHLVKDAVKQAVPEVADVLVHIEPARDTPALVA